MDRPRPSDKCCAQCRTPYGICALKHQCRHHRDAQWAIDMWDLEAEQKEKAHRRSGTSVRQ